MMLIPVSKIGRAANSVNGTAGVVVHVVDLDQTQADGYLRNEWQPALCGDKPRSKRRGWAADFSAAVTCHKCQAKLSSREEKEKVTA